MNNKIPKHPFEELFIPRKELQKTSGCYRVYKDAANYITVEAASALEALKKYGVTPVHRIERDAIYFANVLNLGALSNNPAPTAPSVGELELVPAAPKPEEPTAAPTAPPADAADPVTPPATDTAVPLSTTDVDKLLKSEGATGAQ